MSSPFKAQKYCAHAVQPMAGLLLFLTSQSSALARYASMPTGSELLNGDVLFLEEADGKAKNATSLR